MGRPKLCYTLRSRTPRPNSGRRNWGKSTMSSRWLRNSFIYLLILVAVVAIVFSFFNRGGDAKTISFSEVVALSRVGDVEKILVSNQNLEITKKSDPDTKYKSRMGESTDVEQVLREEGVVIGGDDGVNDQVQGAVVVRQHRRPADQLRCRSSCSAPF